MSAVDAVRRPSSPAQRGRLKLATKASVEDAGGATDLHRERMVRVGPAALSRASVHSVENDDHFVGIDTALDLDLLAGEPRHARALAEAQNYTLTPLEPSACGPIGHPGLNRMTRFFANLELAMRVALEDDEISVAEAAAALPLVVQAKAELLVKEAKLLAIVQREAAA